jgi:hypothetical protein
MGGTRTSTPRYLGAVRPVAELVAEPLHAGSLAGADRVGEARGDGLRIVRIGVWTRGGRLVRARFRATTCASLVAYAEAACALLEAGVAPPRLGAALRGAVAGVHRDHLDRADLVEAAARAALPRGPEHA